MTAEIKTGDDSALLKENKEDEEEALILKIKREREQWRLVFQIWKAKVILTRRLSELCWLITKK